MDHGVREKAFDRLVRQPSRFRFGDIREFEVVDAGCRHMTNGGNPEERERLLDALGLGVHDARLEFDAYLDLDPGRGRVLVLPERSYRAGEITNAPVARPRRGHPTERRRVRPSRGFQKPI